MRRREFIGAFVGVAVWPVAGHAQQERLRRIGVLLAASADDRDYQSWVAAFIQELAQTGWNIGRNIRIEIRWAGAKPDDVRKNAAELAAQAPDVILAHGTSTLRPLLQATRTVPIVFPVAGDPVGLGLIESLSRPGGNATGFMTVEFSIGGKWLELLKEVAPHVVRAGVLRDASQGSGTSQFAAVQAMAPSLGVNVSPIDTRDAGVIERGITAIARSPNGGLIVTAAGSTAAHRNLITKLAVQHKLPAVYNGRHFVNAGGLLSYDADYIDQYRRAARYVDRILRGEKPGDLPVQAPTKYELIINLKTAKALSLTVPPTLLTRADDVVE